MNAASKLKTIASEKLNGVVYATSYLSDARTTICVCGDPTGLRSLARKLPQLADLDQSELDGNPRLIGICCLYLTLSLPNAVMAMKMLQANGSKFWKALTCCKLPLQQMSSRRR